MAKIHSARKFLEELREEFQPLKGKASVEKLKFFVEQQFHIVSGDFRNLALFIAFSPNQRIRDFFFELIQGERSALDNLFKMAKALGIGDQELEASEPHAGSLAFTNYFTRLATYGTEGEIASAIIIDFEVWGENCSRISKGLKRNYNFTSEDTKFLDGFYPITSQFYDKITKIIGEYARIEKDIKKMRIATRLGLDYELMFWDTML